MLRSLILQSSSIKVSNEVMNNLSADIMSCLKSADIMLDYWFLPSPLHNPISQGIRWQFDLLHIHELNILLQTVSGSNVNQIASFMGSNFFFFGQDCKALSSTWKA